MLFSLISGLQPVAVSSNGLFCAIVLLFLMLLFVISSIALCKWRMNKILGFTMFLLYFVFLIISVMLEDRIISCPVSVWVRVTSAQNGHRSETHARSHCTSCHIKERMNLTWEREVSGQEPLMWVWWGLKFILGSTCSSLRIRTLEGWCSYHPFMEANKGLSQRLF